MSALIPFPIQKPIDYPVSPLTTHCNLQNPHTNLKQNHQASALSIMDAQQQVMGSRFLAVDSNKSWEIVFGRAQAQDCPVVVHFTADWCAPSKYMAGFFENLSFPTFLLMKGGVQEDKIVGANTDELQKRVAAFAQMVRQSTEDKA